MGERAKISFRLSSGEVLSEEELSARTNDINAVTEELRRRQNETDAGQEKISPTHNV